VVDRTTEIRERFWVLRAFSHYDELEPDRENPTVIRCGQCNGELLVAGQVENDDVPLLMWQDKPICAADAMTKIGEHPVTPSYMQWLEEGDPRWWSPWFCGCAGCEPPLRALYEESSGQSE